MRTAILALATLALASTSAMATSLIRYQTSSLEQTAIDRLFHVGDEVVGQVQVDHHLNEVSLTLTEVTDPELSRLPRIREFKLPIVNVENSCGSVIYVAQTPYNPHLADGFTDTIRVADHSARMCMDLRAGITEVTLNRTGGRAGVSIDASFVGSRLTPSGRRPRPDVQKTTFNRIKLDKSLAPQGLPVTGKVAVDFTRQVVTLEYHVTICPATGDSRPRCMSEIAPEVIILPISEIQQEGSCGSTIIRASRDQRPVDGMLDEIVVQDNRTRICDDFRPGLTEVTLTSKGYDRLKGSEFVQESFFSGPALK